MQNCRQPAGIISMVRHLHVWLQFVYILLIVYLMYYIAYTLTLSYRTLAFTEDNFFFAPNNAVVEIFMLQTLKLLFCILVIFITERFWLRK